MERVAGFLFALLASVFIACVTTQVFLAGLAVFVDAGDWALHTNFVHAFSLLPLLLIALAFLGRLPVAARWQSFALFVMIVVQYLTVIFAANLAFLSALHPVVALGLFWTSYTLTQLAWRSWRAGSGDGGGGKRAASR